jgi:glycosyltransferase involved in cell wall biosynthesis
MNEALDKKAQNQGEKDVQNYIEKYNLEKNIIFLPTILPVETPSYYSASDIVCVPSIGETFGLVYLEAMASGKIAIASNTGGPREFIKNGKNGFLVSPNDSSKLAKILGKLILDSKTREVIGRYAQKSVRKFTTEKSSFKIKKIYEELV